ncbi:sulfurtransferase [Streptomyces paludis]|uniref:thiosulfate sulfurtransferase n=1 Tax=Streptomyces paludis TaxID=2282738 RepID=A0A345HZ77_9ACTN|nr:rhodanese-like domain-containing protein [Streptomyces paludis]AXG82001.1 sulfurtransferase [Streptomyces paludis]
MTTTARAALVDARTAYAERSRCVFVEVAPWRSMAQGPDPVSGSVPGARRARVRSDFAGLPTATSGHLPLPAPGAVRDTLAAHGAGPADDLVLYTRRTEELSSATRAWYVLTWAGFRSVRVLDGGLPAWVRAGGPTTPLQDIRTTGPVTGPSEPVPPAAGGRRVLDAADVLDISRYGTLLDSRPAHAYHGALDDPGTGHIPHAVHAHSAELVAPDGLLRPPVELRKWFLSRGAIGGHEVGAYCGGGVSSSLLVFVGALLGQQVGLYVDSWSGWTRDASRPVERGSALTRSAAVDTDCV